MIKTYIYEGKNREELIEQIELELGVNQNEMIMKENIVSGKIFKNKKYILDIMLKKDIIEYLKEFIKILSISFNTEINSEIKITDENINIMLVSDNNSSLIGANGRTLNSLQQILKQIVKSKISPSLKINVDVSNYKNKKMKALERETARIAKEVLKTKVEVKLDAMNSYERRLVHSIVTKFENLETESNGEEPNRYVIIKYKNEN